MNLKHSTFIEGLQTRAVTIEESGNVRNKSDRDRPAPR